MKTILILELFYHKQAVKSSQSQVYESAWIDERLNAGAAAYRIHKKAWASHNTLRKEVNTHGQEQNQKRRSSQQC